MSSGPERNLLRREIPVERYDAVYSFHAGDGAAYGAYDRPYWQSHYYPLYKAALQETIALGTRSLLEVGCGSGSFAHLLLEKSTLQYHGIDFSEAAIRKAALRTGRPELFSVANARDDIASARDFDTIVCLEVLEHIEDDLGVMAGWRRGCGLVCSVPNFDAPDHVRLFRSEQEVCRRYEKLVEFERIRRIPRALVRGRGWREYGRQLRWSRDDPKRFLGMLGYRTFEYVAGWLVFSGTRR